MKKLPGGELANRPLHFFWITDCSGSMSGDKIQQLNTAIRETIPHMQKVADENPNANILIRAIKFSNGAQWHVSQPTSVSEFKWVDLTAGGMTDMGKALSMLAEQLKIPPMTDRALPPVLVMISDGQPTDEFTEGLNALMALPWGKKAVRVAIAIGKDADCEILQQFIGHSEMQPLKANNPEQLVNYIRWVSTAVIKSVSSPPSQIENSGQSILNVPLPPLPPDDSTSVGDVW
jgi:uncharacterized protein YegL